MRATAAAIGLACLLWFVYAPVTNHAFVEFDDPLYVTENPHVARGLDADGFAWAWTNDVAFVWHPLTWLSYLASSELHGTERAGPWLLTNVLLHALTASALLIALALQTGRLGAALLVAALFALHPLQVEAVAWVSGRKDVLAGLFAMLTLAAYGAHAARPSPSRLALVGLAYAACLLAKGSLIGLPGVLLAWDVWPLRRIDRSTLRDRLLEKLPLFALAIADLAMQIDFAGRSANVWGTDPPLLERIPIAIMAIAASLRRVFWPSALSVSYPTPMQMGQEPWSGLVIVAAALVIGALVLGAWALSTRRPAVTLGIVWFLLLLAPLAGWVPAGLRSMHDRYTYVPLAGLAIALVYGFPTGPTARRVGVAASVVALVVCIGLTRQQIQVWSDSESLFRHALDVAEHNAVVRYSRGIARAKRGRTFEAIPDLEAALAVHPDHADAHASLGFLLTQQGDLANAMPHLEQAVALRPGWALAHTNLGRALEARGDRAEALAQFEAAVAAAPDSADAHYWLGRALAGRGRLELAQRHLARSLEIEPGHAWARDAMARVRQARRTSAP